jgi:hypothetical protein
MTYETLRQLAGSFPLKVRVLKVWPGFARNVEEIRARLAGGHIAEFPLVVLEKNG